MSDPISEDNLHDKDPDELSLKERIMLSAIEEFGRNGYEIASTNDIVKNAGTSKGLLFHYYKNKNNLYLESLLYVIESLMEYMEAHIDFTDGDMFERIKNVAVIKMNFCCERPYFLGIMNNAWYSDSRKKVPGLEELLNGSIKEYGERVVWSKFYKNVQTDRFREGVDIPKVLDYMAMIADASWQRFSKKYADDYDVIVNHMDEYMLEVDEIMNLMKYGTYRSVTAEELCLNG